MPLKCYIIFTTSRKGNSMIFVAGHESLDGPQRRKSMSVVMSAIEGYAASFARLSASKIYAEITDSFLRD